MYPRVPPQEPSLETTVAVEEGAVEVVVAETEIEPVAETEEETDEEALPVGGGVKEDVVATRGKQLCTSLPLDRPCTRPWLHLYSQRPGESQSSWTSGCVR